MPDFPIVTIRMTAVLLLLPVCLLWRHKGSLKSIEHVWQGGQGVGDGYHSCLFTHRRLFIPKTGAI